MQTPEGQPEVVHDTGESPVHVVTMKIDRPGFLDMIELWGRLRSPNLPTAIYNAVRLCLQLRHWQDNGWEFEAWKPGDRRPFRLP